MNMLQPPEVLTIAESRQRRHARTSAYMRISDSFQPQFLSTEAKVRHKEQAQQESLIQADRDHVIPVLPNIDRLNKDQVVPETYED